MSPEPDAQYGPDLAAIHAAGFTDAARAAAELILPVLPGRARIVDLGCGDGTSASVLVRAGHEVHGIDQSEAFVAMARERVQGATFTVGSFLDAPLPRNRDAVLAVGEVLGYRFGEGSGEAALDSLFARCAAALAPGGMLLFDLAGPGRVPETGARSWSEGEGWAVLVDAQIRGRELTRRLVAFRRDADGRHRRSEEVHRQHLHEPGDVLERLERAGFSGRVLPGGYGSVRLPPGVTVFRAVRPDVHR